MQKSTQQIPIISLIFLLICACSHPLIHEETFLTDRYVAIGLTQEEIIGRIGHPDSIEKSPFGREIWIYPATMLQTTYSNAHPEGPGWHLFLSHETIPSSLILQFDPNGHLQCLLQRLPEDEALKLINDSLEK